MKSGTPTDEIVFSDEKMFTVEAQFNPQNDRVLARHLEGIPEDMLIVYCRQKPAPSSFGLQCQKLENPLEFL